MSNIAVFQEEYSGAERSATVTRTGAIRTLAGPFSEVNATGTGNINYTTNIDASILLNHISVKFSGTPTQPFNVTLVSRLGTQYNATLHTSGSFSAGDTADLFIPAQPLWLFQGDEINVTCSGSDGLAYGIRIVYTMAGESSTTSTSTSTSSTTTSSSTTTTQSTSTTTSTSITTSTTTSTSSTTTSSSTTQSTS